MYNYIYIYNYDRFARAVTLHLHIFSVRFKAHFPLGDFFRANKQKANVIGW